MTTTLLVANPPKHRTKRRPKARKPHHRTRQETTTVSTTKKKSKSKSTPKARKGKKRSAGGIAAIGRGFLNVNLLIQGGVAGAGFVGTMYAAPRIGEALNKATNGWSSGATGQIVTKVALGLGTYALGRKFLPKYATAAAIGVLGSAAVDVWGMFSSGFLRGTSDNAGGTVDGFFGPSQYNAAALPAGAASGNGIYSPYGGVRMAA